MFLSKHRISLSESQEHKTRLRIVKIILTIIILSLFSTYLISLVISDMNSKKIKETYLNLNGPEENSQEMLDLVYNFEISKFNSQNVYYKVIYNGPPNKFINDTKKNIIDKNILFKRFEQ